MLTHLKKLQLIVRFHAVFNILLVMILVIYLCQVVVSEYLDQSHDLHSNNQPRVCWMLWITVSLIAVIIIPLQLIADAFLFTDMNDTLRAIQKYEQWLRVSILFLVHGILSVFLTLFCPFIATGSPVGGFILIALIFISRLGAMYTVYNCRQTLLYIVYQTTVLASQGGTAGAAAANGQVASSGANGECRNISPDFLRNIQRRNLEML